MRTASLWAGLLGIEGTTVKAVELDLQGRLRVLVQLRRQQRHRCGICHRPCPYYDRGEGIRHWRVLDRGATLAYLEAEAPHVRCRQHGLVVAPVPWARHHSRFSRTFEDQVAWLVTRCDLTAVAELMRIAWCSVGAIIARVSADAERGRDRMAGLRRIGIDEISYLARPALPDRGRRPRSRRAGLGPARSRRGGRRLLDRQRGRPALPPSHAERQPPERPDLQLKRPYAGVSPSSRFG